MSTEQRPNSDVTALLRAWSDGDEAALHALMPLVEGELKRLARHYMRGERPGHSLQPTALVNEAFLRLVEQPDVPWQGRAHFYGIAARLMRRILVDHARTRQAAKRGAGAQKVSLAHADGVVRPDGIDLVDILAVHEVLGRLEALDPRQAQVVELRLFGGLTVEEVATLMSLSPATVKREWESARVWLARELRRTPKKA